MDETDRLFMIFKTNVKRLRHFHAAPFDDSVLTHVRQNDIAQAAEGLALLDWKNRTPEQGRVSFS